MGGAFAGCVGEAFAGGEAFGETGGPFTFCLLGVAGGSCLTLAAGLFEGIGVMAKAASFFLSQLVHWKTYFDRILTEF